MATEKIVTSADEFDSLDLDLGLDTPTPVTTDSSTVDELGDLNLDDDPPAQTAAPVDEVREEMKNEPLKKSDPLETLDIDIEEPVSNDTQVPTDTKGVQPEPQGSPVVAPPKQKGRGRPRKTITVSPESKGSDVADVPVESETVATPGVTETTSAPETTNGSLNGKYDPIFDINLVKMGKYQTRQTHRTKEDLDELIEKIKTQGQLEPIHIHKMDGEYQLLAGFGRVAALTALNLKTVKAIIYEGLSESDLYMISTGTNEARLALSDWDKIASIGQFSELHPDVPKTNNPDKRSIPSIFGLSQATVYNYLNIFSFFKDKNDYLLVLKTVRVPYHCLQTILQYRDEIKSHDVFAALMKTSISLGKKAFEQLLQSMLAEEKVKEKINKEELDVSGLDDLSSTSTTEEEGLPTTTVSTKEEKDDSTKRVDDTIAKLNHKIVEVEQLLNELFTIDNYKLYIKADKISPFMKRVAVVGKMQMKLI